MTCVGNSIKSEAKHRVLVTGAAGLIGSAVVRLLLLKGFSVLACDDFSVGEWQGVDDRLVWQKMDVSIPLSLERLNEYDIDMAIHCAAHPCALSLSDPIRDVEVNALGSIRIFKWCAEHNIPIIYTSSNIVYGDQPERPISETALIDIRTIYGACKIACENFLRILGDEYGLRWVALRLFSTYGAGHKPSSYQGIVNVMLTQLLGGNRVIVKGSLERVRDLLYVEDAASGICSCIGNSEACGQIINIATGVPTTIGKLIDKLCTIIGKKVTKLEIIEEGGTFGDPFYNVADCSRAKEILGFTPKYDLMTGLTELVKARLGKI